MAYKLFTIKYSTWKPQEQQKNQNNSILNLKAIRESNHNRSKASVYSKFSIYL